RRIANHDDVLSLDLDPKRLKGAALRDGRQPASRLMVGAVRAHDKAIRVDSRRRKFRPRAVDEIACEKPEHDVLALFERVEELVNAGHHANAVGPTFQLLLEIGDISLEERLHALVDVSVAISRNSHQLAYN